LLLPPPTSTLFPYTTLFRSVVISPALGAAKSNTQQRSCARTCHQKTASGPCRSAVHRWSPLLGVNHCCIRRSTPLPLAWWRVRRDRKSTRLNSSHSQISYAV